ncbi:hypothetical protein [Pseudomonas sp. MIACH]|jgi:hypothetical protein|uniref:hypothetical protein n=1 Tax=Pseudomonas sp. MIACH TaxID=1078355 RepID=UPI000B2E619B|nr:hypothetical protein [Pseudomonas sp. MIACH]
MVSAKNEKRSEELLPAPVIPGELNSDGLISVEDARRGFLFECKVDFAHKGDVLNVLLNNAPLFHFDITHDMDEKSPPIEFTFPARLARDGTYFLKQALFESGSPVPVISDAKQFIIDFTPHYEPAQPSLLSNLPDGKVTSDYLDEHGGVKFSFEDPEDWQPGDTNRLYWCDEFTNFPPLLERVPLEEKGNTYLLKADDIRRSGPGRFYFWSALQDLAGNISRASSPVILQVDL